MDYLTLPPEINSARIESGAGATPLLQAAAAWTSLANGLSETVSQHGAVTADIAATWFGPSAAAFSAASNSLTSWIMQQAGMASQTAAAATMAASAYSTTRAAMVPLSAVLANRVQLAALVATNILGQNTPAIMATEAIYAEMWAQDVAAMVGYQTESAAATAQLTRPTPAPQVTNPAALNAASTGVGSIINPNGIPIIGLDNGSLLGQYLQAFISSGPANIPIGLLSLFTVLWGVSAPNSPLAQAITNKINAGQPVILPEVTTPAAPAAMPSPKFGAISAGIADGERVGALSVSPNWAQPPKPSETNNIGERGPERPLMDYAPLAGLGGLGGLGALAAIPRGGTPTKQQRPQPEYGIAPTVMPKHPFGG